MFMDKKLVLLFVFLFVSAIFFTSPTFVSAEDTNSPRAACLEQAQNINTIITCLNEGTLSEDDLSSITVDYTKEFLLLVSEKYSNEEFTKGIEQLPLLNKFLNLNSVRFNSEAILNCDDDKTNCFLETNPKSELKLRKLNVEQLRSLPKNNCNLTFSENETNLTCDTFSCVSNETEPIISYDSQLNEYVMNCESYLDNTFTIDNLYKDLFKIVPKESISYTNKVPLQVTYNDTDIHIFSGKISFVDSTNSIKSEGDIRINSNIINGQSTFTSDNLEVFFNEENKISSVVGLGNLKAVIGTTKENFLVESSGGDLRIDFENKKYTDDIPTISVIEGQEMTVQSKDKLKQNQKLKLQRNKLILNHDEENKDSFTVGYEVFDDISNDFVEVNKEDFQPVQVKSIPDCKMPVEKGVSSGIPNLPLRKIDSTPQEVDYDALFVPTKTNTLSSRVYILPADWKIVFSLTPIVVSQNAALLVVKDINKESLSTKNFIEDYKIQEKIVIKSEEDAKKLLKTFISKNNFDTYTTANNPYYGLYASWFASDGKINGQLKAIPFVPESWKSDLTLPDKEISLENVNDLIKVEKAYANSNPKTITTVLTDSFYFGDGTLKDNNMLLAPFYAAKKHAFVILIDHADNFGNEEKCSMIAAQFANKIDGINYATTNKAVDINKRSLHYMGLDVNSIDPNQGFVLYLASADSIPIFATEITGSQGQAPSCDYEIARSRLRKNEYVLSWNYGRIGLFSSIDQSSAILNRGIFYDDLFQAGLKSKVLLTQEVEYFPYHYKNGAFKGSHYTKSDFDLYSPLSYTLAIVDPADEFDNRNIKSTMKNSTVYINHAHGGHVPNFYGRGKNTVILNDGCSDIGKVKPFLDWMTAYVGSTEDTTGMGNYDLRNKYLGEYISTTKQETMPLLTLIGDPTIKVALTGAEDKSSYNKLELNQSEFKIPLNSKRKKYMDKVIAAYSSEYSPSTQETNFDEKSGNITEQRNVYSLSTDFALDYLQVNSFTLEDGFDNPKLAYCKYIGKLVPLFSMMVDQKIPASKTYSFNEGTLHNKQVSLAQKEDIIGVHAQKNIEGEEITLRSSPIDYNPFFELSDGQDLDAFISLYCAYVNNIRVYGAQMSRLKNEN